MYEDVVDKSFFLILRENKQLSYNNMGSYNKRLAIFNSNTIQ